MFRKIRFDIGQAYRAIRSNRMRAGITIVIIALGIMALVGILTAIDGLKANIYANFSGMGANTFQITNEMLKRGRRNGIRSVEQKNISYREALSYKEQLSFPATVSLSALGSGAATVKFAEKKTNPNIVVMGVDGNYLTVSNTSLAAGRNFSATEQESGSYVCILGYGVAAKLFGSKPQDAVDKKITIGFVRYRVIGVSESKGSSMISRVDNSIFVPLQNVRSVYAATDNFVISVYVPEVAMIDAAAEESEGLFRNIRRIPLGVASNFSINKNDNLVSMVMENINFVTIAAVFIGLITLLGAAIGLMNIMLVSVAERTREIGVNKALGARNSEIRRPFLTEALVICMIGGALGVLLGIIVGNIVSVLLKSGFIVPWLWMLMGLTLCTLVGLTFGIYPASKAAKLNPINALRYE